MRRTVLFFAAIAAGCGPEASRPADAPAGRTVAVAAASDLKFALDEIAAEFARRHPDVAVKTTYGSSGNFYSQLANRAPFDLYFSADIGYPRKLIEQGHADADSLFPYAVGRVVAWVPEASKLDVRSLGIRAVADPSVRKVAIANPKHAPYGRAAEAALRKLGVYDSVADRLVLGENIAQTAQFVETGGADVGLIALSLAVAPAMKDKGRYWEVPADAHPPLEQGGVILKWAKDPEAAKMFRDFVISAEGRAILKRYGFEPPGE
jgi:molybdate transport system substrate-binding protein